MAHSRGPDDIPSADAVAAPRPPGGPVRLRPEHLYKAVGLAFLLALLYHFFAEIARVLLVVYAAAILAVAFNALIGGIPLQRRWKAGLLGVLIVGLVGLAVGFGAPALFQQLRGLSGQVPQLEQQLQSWERWLEQSTGIRVNLVGEQARGFLEAAFLGSDGQQALGRARGALEFLILPLLILFGALFAVGKPNDRLLTPVLRAVPRERRLAFERVFELLGIRLLGWIKGTLLSMLIVGALSVAAFYLLGLRYALLLGVVNGLLEFVPLVGPWVGGTVAVLVAFLQDPQLALWTALVVLGIQQLESNLITPLVMAKAAEVHPFVTLFAIVLFGTLFGMLGILLALPLVLLVWTTVEVLWVERAIDTDEDAIQPVVEED